MLKSLYLRRTLLLVLVSVLLSAVLTALLYAFVARITFSRMKTEEMNSVSVSVEETVVSYLTGTLPDSYVERLLAAHAQVYGTYILVFNYNADVSFSVLDENITGELEPLAEALQADVQGFLQGDPAGSIHIRDYSNFVAVGRPITVGNSIYGSVVLLMPMREVTAALAGLLRTLILSSFLVILLMLLPAYILSRRFVQPLHKIKNVAAALSNGDFSIRAGNRFRGEYAELATAFDHLADNLSHTISELSLERTRLRRMVDGLNEGILSLDANGVVTHANPAIAALFGQTDPFPDAGIRSVFDEVLADHVSRVGDIAVGDKTIRYTVTPLDGENKTAVAGAVGLFRDVTESHRLEQTRRDYVANVSHELRTPLTAMRALVEPLADNMVSSEEDRGRYYSMLLSEIRRLTRLINDMLELSRLQAGSVSMSRDAVGLHDLLDGVTTKYSVVAEDAGLRFETPYRNRPDACVRVNRDRIEQILVILLDNAVKYTQDGGYVAIDLTLNEEKAAVTVADSGAGIAPEDLPHVFERFYKSDKSHKPASGTGLGLSIAREILDAMGESIDVESQPGYGTAFTFTLPLLNGKQEDNTPNE